MLKLEAAVVAAILVLAAPALGQTAKPGAHGGQVRMAEGHAIELVSTDREIAFYVLEEDGKALDTKGTTGRAIIQEGGKSTTVTLAGAAPNKLSGPLTAPLATGAKIVMTARVHGHSLQARFEVP